MPRKKAGGEEIPSGGTIEERLVAKLGTEQARMASEPLACDVTDWVSTQCAILDYAIGRPGIPCNKLTLIIGKEGAGKSTLLYHILAETQRRGGVAALADAEDRYSRDRGERLGIDHSKLVILRGHTLEQVFKRMEESIDYVRSEDPGLMLTIGLDSLAALPTQKMYDTDLEESGGLGTAARMVSRELQRLHPKIAEHRVALVIVNQLRQHIDASGDPRSRQRRKVMRQNAMIAEGPLVYWASLVIYLTSTGVLGEGDPTGISVRADIRKSSVAPESKTANFDIDFLWGIDQMGARLDLLEEIGEVTRSGAWYTLGDQKFQRRSWPQVWEEHPELEELVHKAPLLWLPNVVLNGGEV